MVLTALELNVAVAFGEQLAQLEQRLLRENDADVLVDAARLVLDFDERQAMAVGRDQRQACGFSTNFAPFRKYRVSSPVIAYCVFATISFTAARGSVARACRP